MLLSLCIAGKAPHCLTTLTYRKAITSECRSPDLAAFILKPRIGETPEALSLHRARSAGRVRPGCTNGLCSLLFRLRHLKALFALLQESVPRHGVSVGENRNRLQHSSITQPKGVNGASRNNYAGLGFDLMFLVADTREAVAIDFEEDQYFFSIVLMQRCSVMISYFS